MAIVSYDADSWGGAESLKFIADASRQRMVFWQTKQRPAFAQDAVGFGRRGFSCQLFRFVGCVPWPFCGKARAAEIRAIGGRLLWPRGDGVWFGRGAWFEILAVFVLRGVGRNWAWRRIHCAGVDACEMVPGPAQVGYRAGDYGVRVCCGDCEPSMNKSPVFRRLRKVENDFLPFPLGVRQATPRAF